MANGKLNVRRVETASPGKHEDGDGLRLVVSATGSRRWVFRFRINQRSREMGLGSWPEVTLARARETAAQHRKTLGEGRDPITVRDARRVEIATKPTFTRAAARYIRAHRRGWSNPKHARQWPRTLKTYARPIIGEKPVDEIGTEDLLTLLWPIWHVKTETAKRVQTRIENILDYAAAMKWRDPANPARWRGHLDKLLPKPARVGNVRHHPAMSYTELPKFMAELRTLGSVSARALEFLILTATRTGEALQATWDEFDLDACIWTIPAARMKARREHRVPLADAAVDILRTLPRMADNPHVFIGARCGRPLSNMALLQLMRGLGYGNGKPRGACVPHGFRSSFRDWAGEVSSFPRDVCEMALAHVIDNRVEAAYRRGDLFEKRRAMMHAWALFIAPAGDGVVVGMDRKRPSRSSA